ITEGAAHFVPSRCAVTKGIGDFDFIERPVFRLLNESQNLRAQISFPFAFHGTQRCVVPGSSSSPIFHRTYLGIVAGSRRNGGIEGTRHGESGRAEARPFAPIFGTVIRPSSAR